MGNAALCLGNCMEVPQAASSLLKTDIVQVLLKLAGSDAQQTAVQLNAGIALGKLCTAEPRYDRVARVSHISEQACQAQPRHRAVARTATQNPVGELRSPCSFCADRCWAPVAAPLEEDFPEGTRSPQALPRQRQDICLGDRDLFKALAAIVLSPFHSLSLSLSLFELLPPLSSTPHPFSLPPSLSSTFSEGRHP